MMIEFESNNVQLTANDGGVVCVTKISTLEKKSLGTIVFIPGLFTGNNFWISARGIGVAAFFASKGYDCCLVERRGFASARGLSKLGARMGLSEHAAYDLPEVQKYLLSESRGPFYWFGHSFGGVVLSKALAQSLDLAEISGVVLVASQCEVGLKMLKPPLSYITKFMSRFGGYFPAKRLRIGSFDEPTSAMEDACNWTVAFRKKTSFFNGFENISVPTLGIVGAGDKSDPPEGCGSFMSKIGSNDKEFKVLGKSTGFSEDFTHAGIIVSKAAQLEVWPLLHSWLQRHENVITSI